MLFMSLAGSPDDKSKLEQLYSRYGRLMKATAADILKQDDLAEDAVHNAFKKLKKYVHKLDLDDDTKTKAYVIRVVVSAANDMIESETRHRMADAAYFSGERIDYDLDDVLDRITAQELASRIYELPEVYSEILELRYYHGLSQLQIADFLNISYTAVRKRLERARKALAKLIKEEGE